MCQALPPEAQIVITTLESDCVISAAEASEMRECWASGQDGRADKHCACPLPGPQQHYI